MKKVLSRHIPMLGQDLEDPAVPPGLTSEDAHLTHTLEDMPIFDNEGSHSVFPTGLGLQVALRSPFGCLLPATFPSHATLFEGNNAAYLLSIHDLLYFIRFFSACQSVF